jgi:hypothetical protein
MHRDLDDDVAVVRNVETGRDAIEAHGMAFMLRAAAPTGRGALLMHTWRDDI